MIAIKNCDKAYEASSIVELILSDFCSGKSLVSMTAEFDKLHSMNAGDITPCMECAPCYDFLFYREKLYQIRMNKISNEGLRLELLAWKKTQLRDEALTHMKYELQPTDFNKKKTIITGIKVYFDQNTLSDYAKEPETRKQIDLLKTKNNLSFYYSPSHLEEIFKMNNEETKTLLISSISALTGNAVVLPEDNTNVFHIEDPKFGLKRIAKYDGSTQALENLMLLSSQDRKNYLTKYDTREHKQKIANNNNIFNSLNNNDFRELIVLSHSSLLNKEEYIGIANRNTTLHAIYTLSNALSLLGYKLDKKEKTIKSAIHDIEHLSYASEADFFVTNDTNLRQRANQIYNFMKINTKAISPDEFRSFDFKQCLANTLPQT